MFNGCLTALCCQQHLDAECSPSEAAWVVRSAEPTQHRGQVGQDAGSEQLREQSQHGPAARQAGMSDGPALRQGPRQAGCQGRRKVRVQLMQSRADLRLQWSPEMLPKSVIRCTVARAGAMTRTWTTALTSLLLNGDSTMAFTASVTYCMHVRHDQGPVGLYARFVFHPVMNMITQAE